MGHSDRHRNPPWSTGDNVWHYVSWQTWPILGVCPKQCSYKESKTYYALASSPKLWCLSDWKVVSKFITGNAPRHAVCSLLPRHLAALPTGQPSWDSPRNSRGYRLSYRVRGSARRPKTAPQGQRNPALPERPVPTSTRRAVGLAEKLAQGGLESGAGIHHWKRPRALPFGTPSLGLWRHSPTGQPSWDSPPGPGAAPYPMACVARREGRGPIPKVNGSRPFMKARYQRAHQGQTLCGASSRCHSSAASNAGTRTPCPQAAGTACRPAAGQAGPRPLGGRRTPAPPAPALLGCPKSNTVVERLRLLRPRVRDNKGMDSRFAAEAHPKSLWGRQPGCSPPDFHLDEFPPSPPAVWQGRGCRQTQGRQR
jgi:hypothetical protein